VLRSSLDYTVPAGYRAVIRSFDVSFNTATGFIWLAIANVGNIVQLVAGGGTPGQGSASWHGRQVANQGEVIQCYGNTSGDCWVSGYLLSVT
jgi:hypothetical protein